LIIEAEVNEIEVENEITFDMSARFDNDWRCPITDYRIERVTEGNTNIMI